MICCICKEEVNEKYGNNPQPVKQGGRCCNDCNYTVVVPTRINQLLLLTSKEEKEND